MTELDTSGYSCPEPVIMTKKALKDSPEGLAVLVDNRASKENVSRYATALGYKVKVEEAGQNWKLIISK